MTGDFVRLPCRTGTWDARRALDLLRVSGEIADRDEAEGVTEKHVKIAQAKIETDSMVEVSPPFPRRAKSSFIP